MENALIGPKWAVVLFPFLGKVHFVVHPFERDLFSLGLGELGQVIPSDSVEVHVIGHTRQIMELVPKSSELVRCSFFYQIDNGLSSKKSNDKSKDSDQTDYYCEIEIYFLAQKLILDFGFDANGCSRNTSS